MNILLTLDENYLLPCKVMLDSLFASNPAETDVTVYLLHSAIPAEKLEELASFCAALGAALRPIAVDAALFESAPTSKRYPKEMYYRLLSPLILPREVERVLYLDPDMLIINPLRPLWEMDLYGKTFAAASHTGLTEMANGINQMRLDTEHEYFNSGVMLIDLTAARKLVTAEDVFACVSEHEKELILPDQDVFNILYGKETRPVEDVLWNYDVRNYSKYLIRSTGKHDLSWVMRNTAVLHFCGRNKPWHEDYKNPFGMLYLHYMNLTLRKRYA
ncbi:MAG: glycosyltransferase family 8 protein [Oscillospiraceae bacterium]